MRYLLYFFLFIASNISGQDLSVLRAEYPSATNDADAADTLVASLKAISKDDDATLTAYKGALLTLKAKFAKSIKRKKSYFTEGVGLLEEAVSMAPNNIEIRCLRLGVQEHSPRIVKYKSDMSTDKQFLLDNFASTKNEDIKSFVKGFVMNSKLFSHSEKQLF